MEFQIKNATPLYEPMNFKINWENISGVYKGVLNACGCGCKGDYFYTQHYANYRANTDGNTLLLDGTSDELDLAIENIIIEKFSNSSDVKYTHVGDEWILEVETSTKRNERDDVVIRGYRIFSSFKPFNYEPTHQ